MFKVTLMNYSWSNVKIRARLSTFKKKSMAVRSRLMAALFFKPSHAVIDVE